MPISAFLHRCWQRRWPLILVPTLALLGDLLWTLGRFPRLHHLQIFSADRLPTVGGAVLVLGAGVYSDGEPTSILEGRLRTALELYRSGRVRWFLVSGDNRHATYNEPQAMRALYLADHMGLQAWGVPARTDDRPWTSRFRFWTREYIARHLALWDAWFPPDARLGPREPTPDDWDPVR